MVVTGKDLLCVRACVHACKYLFCFYVIPCANADETIFLNCLVACHQRFSWTW
jgi:hypothetical protein